MEAFTLSAADYVVFSLVLVVSSAIGIYFSRKKTGGRQNAGEKSLYDVSGQEGATTNNETDDYLVGGRNMHWFPLSISFMATYISGTVLLGVPAEIYTYGFQYVISCGGLVISTFFTWYIFIPIFYRLKIVCANEVGVIYIRAFECINTQDCNFYKTFRPNIKFRHYGRKSKKNLNIT